jgi:hypothetical protein
MPIKSICVCDKCDKVIQKSSDGFIIKGNIYSADVDSRNMLVGDNLILTDGGAVYSVNTSILCRACLSVIFSDMPGIR